MRRSKEKQRKIETMKQDKTIINKIEAKKMCLPERVFENRAI